jgi:hypothetical protein
MTLEDGVREGAWAVGEREDLAGLEPTDRDGDVVTRSG